MKITVSTRLVHTHGNSESVHKSFRERQLPKDLFVQLTSCSTESDSRFISVRAARQLPNERGSSLSPEGNDAALNLPV